MWPASENMKSGWRLAIVAGGFGEFLANIAPLPTHSEVEGEYLLWESRRRRWGDDWEVESRGRTQ
jgi:hypothetical protein